MQEGSESHAEMLAAVLAPEGHWLAAGGAADALSSAVWADNPVRPAPLDKPLIRLL